MSNFVKSWSRLTFSCKSWKNVSQIIDFADIFPDFLYFLHFWGITRPSKFHFMEIRWQNFKNKQILSAPEDQLLLTPATYHALQRTKRKSKRKPRTFIQSIRGLSTVKGAASNWSRLPADRPFRFGPLLYSIRWKYILYVKHWYFHRSLSYNQHLIPHYFLSFRQCLRWNYKLPYQ